MLEYAINNETTEGANLPPFLTTNPSMKEMSVMAYDIAAIIALACNKIFMKKGAYMVISEPTIFQGNGIEKKATSELDRISNTMAAIYMEKCKKTKTKIVKMMEQETWLTDKGAEVDGFIDGVYE